MSIKHQQPLTLLKTLRVQRKVSSSFAFGILLLKCLATDVLQGWDNGLLEKAAVV